MDINARRVENSKAEIDLVAEWKDIEEKYKTVLDNFQEQASIPGFRKGKAPRDVIEKKFAAGALQNAVIEAMDDAIQKAVSSLEDKSFRPLLYSYPEVVDYAKLLPFKPSEDVKFTIRYDVMPDVNVKQYKDIKVEYPNVVISDAMVDAEIERYREQNSEIKSKEGGSVENGDLVTLDYTNLDLQSDDKTVSDYTCTVGKNQNYYKFDEYIIGMKEGEEKEITIKYTKDNKPENLERDEVRLSVKIKSVKSKILPAIDDEFAQDIKSEYKTVADMKKGIKDTLLKGLESRMKDTKADLILEEILKSADPIELPESMVKFEIENTFRKFANQMGMRPEDLEKFLKAQGQSKEQFTSTWTDDAKSRLKKELILTKIETLEKIEPEQEKLEAVMKNQIPETATEDQKEQYKEMIKGSLAREATVDFLIANNKLTAGKKEISYEDFASGAYLKESEEK